MKKLALVAMTAAAALATPAMAQTTTTGTIIINGSVAPKCSVVPNNAGNTWGGMVNLGELAKGDGTLKSSADLTAQFASQGGAAISAKVICTSADSTVTVNADSLFNTAGGLSTGYTDTVHFDADVTFQRTTTPVTISNDSTVTPAPTNLGGRMAPTTTNITVATSDWRTPSAGDLLIAGSYSGQIVVTVAPVTL